MATQTHQVIKKIVDERAKGNTAIVASTVSKLVMKGIGKAKEYYEKPDFPDNPGDLAKAKTAAAEMQITV